MARFTLHLTYLTLIVFLLIFAGQSPVDSSKAGGPGKRAPVADASYRSRASTHKVIVYDYERELRDRILAEGGSVIQEYGGFSLMSATAAAAEAFSADQSSRAPIRDDLNLLLLRAGSFDTTEAEPLHLSSLGDAEPAHEQLYLVQMVGPVKQEWLEQLQASAEIITYIPNNAYLVRADSRGLARIGEMKSSSDSFIQWAGAFKPAYKIAPEIVLDSERETTVTVQLVAGERAASEIEKIVSTSGATVLDGPTEVLNFTNVRMRVRADRVADIARLGEVAWIEPWSAPELFDERQDWIVVGNFPGNELPLPGYISWLNSKGLATTPDFIVDVADSGIDMGLLDPERLHPDFLNQAGLARVTYARFFGALEPTGPPNDISGHGTINAGILGGYNTQVVAPFTDAEGYRLGLGVHPYIKIGVTQVFNPDWTNPNFNDMINAMYRDGARISSNSWGTYNNTYTAEAQIYDSMVRDASRAEQGNQELAILFASGNRGPDILSSPGVAKNVITVGASENLRPGLDGCNVNTDGADDIYSIINFSSGGRTTDGRIKPEIVAPGTHIQGARSQDPGYLGGGVCGPRNWPAGQFLYTWSSGTSHATPAVAGAAALLRQFFERSTGKPPSPAMTKAFLTNTTSYMSGNLAGGNLPGLRQGWGLVNLDRALDDVPRMTIDQSLLVSSSGQVITVRGRVAAPGQPFRVTLAWTDAPGSPAANPVVNNLDLQVEFDGKIYLGNVFDGEQSVVGGSADALNNLEGVWLPASPPGDFVVRVVGTNIAGDGMPGNNDLIDQDFALVIYNGEARPDDDGGGGGGGGGPVDTPPTVDLRFPNGGETLTVGNLARIMWEASDDKQIQSQKVEFSSDGTTFNLLAVLPGNERHFDWRIPAILTPFGKIKVSALDGVNLPISAVSAGNFSIINGPPDLNPPSVLLNTPTSESVIGGGLTTSIRWKETDNVGVIRRVIEFSTDNGQTFQQIISLLAPSSGEQQSYDWQVPAALATTTGKIRITIYDGADNSSTVTSLGKFEVWPMPIITGVDYDTPGRNRQLEVFGRNFRMDETEVYVNGVQLKKIRFNEQCEPDRGTCRKVTSVDKKIHKRVPENVFVNITVKTRKTGQVSPEFAYKRPKR